MVQTVLELQRSTMMSITPRSSEHFMGHGPYSIIRPQQSIAADEEYRDDTGNTLKRTPKMAAMLEPHDADMLNGVCGDLDTQHNRLLVIGMPRSPTLQSLSGSSTSSVDSGLLQESTTRLYENFPTFGMDLRRETQDSPDVPVFGKGTRRVMESHLRRARLLRDKARNHASIATSVGVPYVRLRSERPFLFDVHTHPINEVLAETLGIEDLSRLHEEDDLQRLMTPLRTREGRRKFHESYDNFVTSFCIPLLHSLAMSNNVFYAGSTKSSSISYRYQAFPCIRVVRPGDTSQGPQCDTANGHSIGCLHFHVPLTASFGTNALYAESHPGKEDWHPLLTKLVGLGFLFDGARCLNFNMENTTDSTSVALDFVVSIYGDDGGRQDYVDGDCLCNRTILEDRFSVKGPAFYDEAVINVSLDGGPLWQTVAKKYGKHLLDPDHRVGFPFACTDE
jgi:hypothetical protein